MRALAAFLHPEGEVAQDGEYEHTADLPKQTSLASDGALVMAAGLAKGAPFKGAEGLLKLLVTDDPEVKVRSSQAG